MSALPRASHQIWNVWSRNFLLFRRSWSVSVFWILLEPSVILGSIGFGVGAYINEISGVTYIDFFFPALLCSTAMFVSFFESTYANFSKLTYQQVYKTMILAPVTPRQIVAGEILWAASKGSLSSLGIIGVGAVLGLIDDWMIVPTFGVVFLTSVLFASLGMLVTSIVKNYDSIIYPTSGLIVPMSLLSGTYFPIEQMPPLLKYLVYLLPLTHSVAWSRGLLLKGFAWIQIYYFLFLISVTYFVFNKACDRIQKKLIQ